MNFSEKLNEYILLLDCTAKELAAASGLSCAAVSRYSRGERVPNVTGGQVKKLSTGIAALAESKGIPELTKKNVTESLSDTLRANQIVYDRLVINLNRLISVMNIRNNELARFLSFDASYLSRIRSGHRRPADIQAFVIGVSRFVVRRYIKEDERATVAELIKIDIKQTETSSAYLKHLSEWLSSGTQETHDYMGEFLKKLDEFDFSEYIRAIRFDELKTKNIPFQIPLSKHYYGIEEMKQGELDFFKSTVLSKNSGTIFMCSDMPLEDMAKDIDFGKKWMYAIAMSLKKGLHLDIIHSIDRPLKEMMLGLESWIPIYMTGQVSPYYLKGPQNGVYRHFNYVSDTAALTGECIDGFHKNGKYYLTKKKDEVAYYRQKANDLLSKAYPLMDIYRKNTENAYRAVLMADSLTNGIRHNILSSMPLYTLTEKMMKKILKRHFICESDCTWLLAHAAEQKKIFESVLQSNNVCDEIINLSKEEFEQYPMLLSLSGAFFEKEITYTYEEYLEHLRLTKEAANIYQNYSVQLNNEHAFRNIQIMIHKGKWAIISKNKSPITHFVIHHSKMLDALENFSMPVFE